MSYCDPHGLYHTKEGECPYCQIEALEAELAAKRYKAIQAAVDRFYNYEGEPAYDNLAALMEKK